jgi:alanyl-tRNA synthetase
VAPDRLRFDFSHFEAVTPEELERVEDLTNREIITDAPVRHYETTKDHAEALGAIAFFGDKYGDLVRVLEAGEHSLELCGGTHVHALGFIGPVKIVSESSIGANLRRIEAVTGDAALEHIRAEEHTLRATADALKVKPEELPGRVERLRDELRAVQAELAAQRDRETTIEATALAASAVDGVVVEQRDGHTNDELRRLAVAARDALGRGVVGLVGASPDGTSAAVAVAVSRDLVDQGVSATEIALPAARVLGGGTGKKATDVAAGGGRNASAVSEARAILAREARAVLAREPKAAVGTPGDR